MINLNIIKRDNIFAKSSYILDSTIDSIGHIKSKKTRNSIDV